MTDYTKNASFTAKTGTPITGADFDSEFDEIATAVASKEDKASKGVSNGYCGLDSGGLVAKADLPATTAYTDVVNTFSSAINISGATPYLNFVETGVTADNTTWRLIADGENFYGYVMADNLGSGNQWLALTRTGITVDSLALAATAIALNGAVAITGSATLGGAALLTTSSGLSASNINAGSIGNAYVPVGAVTQHQASLSIAETQITDGSTFPRIGSTETITGSWSFNGFSGTANGNITRSGKGVHPYFATSTQNGGQITLSTSAATGTPAAGDIWIQHSA